MNSFVGAVNKQSSAMDILYIWKTPVAQYWFLYALFFLFVIWTIFSGIFKNWQITLLTVAIAYLTPFTGLSLGCFEVVFYSALAFGVGTFVEFSKISKAPVWAKCLVVLLHLLIGIGFIMINKIETAGIKEIMVLIGIYASIMLISMLQNFKWVGAFLGFMNKYSLQIYLLHTIFTAGIRIILMRMSITGWWLHIVAGTVGGIVFSVLVAKIAKRVKFFNFFFFPAKVYKLKK
jgi:hypothetical protein